MHSWLLCVTSCLYINVKCFIYTFKYQVIGVHFLHCVDRIYRDTPFARIDRLIPVWKQPSDGRLHTAASRIPAEALWRVVRFWLCMMLEGFSIIINPPFHSILSLQDYTSKHLKGLTVEHSQENFVEGKTVILTLKDKGGKQCL